MLKEITHLIPQVYLSKADAKKCIKSHIEKIMTSLGKVRTESESKGYYRDVLQSQLNNTFDLSEDRLLFITYQPTEKTYLPQTVIDFTYELFKDYPYIEVIERTYKHKAKKNGSDFDDTYHSHILIRLDDYNALERKLGHKLGVKLNIVDKVVWDLDGLVERYLIKQKGVTRLDMDLPIRHFPVLRSETEPQPIKVTIGIRLKLRVQCALRVFYSVSISKIVSDCFKKTNKLYWRHIFIDDT